MKSFSFFCTLQSFSGKLEHAVRGVLLPFNLPTWNKTGNKPYEPGHRYLYSCLVLVFLFPLSLAAQISFTNSNSSIPDFSAHSGVAIAVLDMNGDGLDDIAHLDEGKFLVIEYQQSDGSFQSVPVVEVDGSSQWSMCAADVDNNGHADVLTGGGYDGIKVVTFSEDGSSFEMFELPGLDIFAQCSNFADINNDGWLDAFVCHDDAESRIWGNDGTGDFFEADEWIDMATIPPSDNSGNYGSVWTDFDGDGDLDLYIAKCRQGVSDPTDPRRINALFVNDGNGNYLEGAGVFGLKIGAQSWTADFADIDNDGDFDCFITNHDVPNMLLENDGSGHFTDITAGSGLPATSFPIQGLMRDFDNDGYVDILVSGGSHHLFRNNGDKTFTEVPNPFDQNIMESFALGDLNHDGFIDVYAGYAIIYTSPSNVEDVLWLNDGNANHFLTVQLTGMESNRSAVGAKVKIFGPWGIQLREVRAGESYGISNSLALHFGLGSYSQVDSLVVYWPAGGTTILQNVPADQFLQIEEEGCVVSGVSIEASDSLTFCSGESVTLTAPEAAAYLWNTGATSQSIVVTEAGTYSVVITDSLGCQGTSPGVEVVVDPDETPQITAQGDTSFCHGSSVLLSSTPAASYLWNTGDTTQSIEVSTSGVYSVSIQGLCETFVSNEIEVYVFQPETPQVQNDTFQQEGQQAHLTAMVSSGNLHWLDESGNLLATGSDFTTPPLNSTTLYQVFNRDTLEAPIDAETGEPGPAGNDLYSGNQYNGSLIFDAYQPFTLEEVTVYTDMPGERRIVLLDESGNEWQGLTVDIPEGESTLALGFEVPVGTGLQLTTDASVNQQSFGFDGPRLQRNKEEGVNYPYEVPDLLRIYDSNFGQDYYYYFFDWRVSTQGVFCSSDTVEVWAVYDPETNLEEPMLKGVGLSPNPTRGTCLLYWDKPLHAPAEARLYDAGGKLLKRFALPTGSQEKALDLGEFPSGMYWLRWVSAGGEVGSWKIQLIR